VSRSNFFSVPQSQAISLKSTLYFLSLPNAFSMSSIPFKPHQCLLIHFPFRNFLGPLKNNNKQYRRGGQIVRSKQTAKKHTQTQNTASQIHHRTGNTSSISNPFTNHNQNCCITTIHSQICSNLFQQPSQPYIKSATITNNPIRPGTKTELIQTFTQR